MLVAFVLSVSAAMPASAGEGTWTRVSPEGEVVEIVAVDPANPDVLVGGSYTTGFSYSVNRGRTWTLSLPRLTEIDVWAIDFDPTRPGVVYATVLSAEFQGLYVSSDRGKTWTRRLDIPAGNIAVQAQAPGTVVVGGWETSVTISADHGATWRRLRVASGGAGVSAAVHPTKPNLLLAGLLARDDTHLDSGGLYWSTDGGVSWIRAKMPKDTDDRFVPVTGLTFSRRGTAAYALSEGELVRSLDGGRTWKVAYTTGIAGAGFDAGPRLSAILPDPLDDSEVFFLGTFEAPGGRTSSRIYHSTDYGRSFALHVSPFESASGISSIALDRANPQTLYAVTNNALWTYTLPARAVGLPATGDPEPNVLSILTVGAALSLIGLRLRTALCDKAPDA